MMITMRIENQPGKNNYKNILLPKIYATGFSQTAYHL